MLIDAKLLPIYKKALKNNPEAIFEIGEKYFYGKGVPANTNLSAEWWEKLLKFKKGHWREDASIYCWAGIAAFNRGNYRLAKQRFIKSYKLLVKYANSDEEFQEQLQGLNLYHWIGHITIMSQFDITAETTVEDLKRQV